MKAFVRRAKAIEKIGILEGGMSTIMSISYALRGQDSMTLKAPRVQILVMEEDVARSSLLTWCPVRGQMSTQSAS